MCKAVLQNRMALHVLTAAHGGKCGIIETECVSTVQIMTKI